MNKLLKIISVVTLLIFLRTSMALCADQVYFYYTDPAGTPLAMSDASGTVVWRADYMPFGEESINTQTAQNNKMFVGKEKDSESGLYYFGARYMDAGAGRFVSPDAVGAVNPHTGEINHAVLEDPQRLNLYSYVVNNPYKYFDPDGNNLRMIGAALSQWSARIGPTVTRAGNAGIALVESGIERSSIALQGITRVRFSSASIEEVAVSSSRLIGNTTEGVRALDKKIGRGLESAFKDLPRTQEAAENVIRSIMSNPTEVHVGEKTVRVFGEQGRGLMYDRETRMFKGFLEGALEK